MSLKIFWMAGLTAISLSFGGSASADVVSSPSKVTAGFSLSNRTVALDSKESVDENSMLDSTSYWCTEGSGSCDTGFLNCDSGRQIGCNATGDYVKCEYTAGDVGWVKCTGSGGGTASTFEDQCP